jgi:ATP-dependent protease HslVU (ClpYQ) peptidase subunit
MTCIVGLVEKGKVYMGADSCGSNGYNSTVRADPKLFHKGEMLIGCTSSYRMGQLLQYKMTIPEVPEGCDVSSYMVKYFIEAVRTCFEEGGFTKIKDNQEEGGSFLVGFRGTLFSIQDDFQVGQSAIGYNACGSGKMAALGALHATIGLPAEERIKKALEAAAEHTAGVRPPFHIMSI